jgi:hypothetical protein
MSAATEPTAPDSEVIVSIQGRTGYVTLNRPKVLPLNDALS